MGASISKQQKQQIASYRTRFIFGEPGLNLMTLEDISDNEKICRDLVIEYQLDKNQLIADILKIIETNDDVIDNNGILLCSSQGINDIFESHMKRSNIYLQKQANNQRQSNNQPQANNQQPYQPQANNQPQGYNAPANTYGNAPANTYGNAPANTYGNAPANTYGNAPANTYGNAPANTYGNAPANTYGNAPANTYGNAPANTYGNAPANRRGGNSSRKKKSVKLFY
jgi:hypothetical protein